MRRLLLSALVLAAGGCAMPGSPHDQVLTCKDASGNVTYTQASKGWYKHKGVWKAYTGEQYYPARPVSCQVDVIRLDR